jgi:pimeloyl-ACP methyl ester carboxylesterase
MQALVRALQIVKTCTLSADGGFQYEGEVKVVAIKRRTNDSTDSVPQERPQIHVWSEMLSATKSKGKLGRNVILLAPGTGDDACAAWPATFLTALRDAGFDVLRFDNRGFGCSTWPDFESDPFGIPDLAGDVQQVLDAWGLSQDSQAPDGPHIHLVGHSMGTAVIQTVVIHQFEERERRRQGLSAVIPLFAICSCVCIGGYAGTDQSGAVPESRWSPELRKFKETMQNGWIWEKNRVLSEWQVASFGKNYPYDDSDFQRRKDVCIRRGGLNVNCPHAKIHEIPDLQPPRRHALSLAVAGWAQTYSHYIKAPLRTLVIHGTSDVTVACSEGEDLHELFRSACAPERLLVAHGNATSHIFLRLEGAGHKYHRAEWDQIASAVCAFIDSGKRAEPMKVEGFTV